METISEGFDHQPWIRGRTFRRVTPPRWPFVYHGLLAVLGFVLVAAFGATLFANNWIEERADDSIRASLDAAGYQWVGLEMSGQQARLSGSAPSTFAGEDALEIARRAECPTWLGPKVCATAVSGAFVTEGVAPDWPDLRGTVAEGVLTFNGQLPAERIRTEMLERAGSAVEAGRVTQIVDDLTIVAATPPAGFDGTAHRLAEVTSMCESGEVILEGGLLSVRCRVSQRLVSNVRALIERPVLGASLGEVRLIVAEEATRCERDLNGLLEESRIEFASGSSIIVPATAPVLDRLAAVAQTCPGLLQIEGHTDNVGPPDLNQVLSLARAGAVRDALRDRGVSPDRLTAAGYGPDDPIADNATAEGRARNRRIEFRVMPDPN